ARLTLTQTRYVPLGSPAERTGRWGIPVCARIGLAAGARETCTLIDDVTQTVPIGSECPWWLLPNADGAGYYRWTLPPADLDRLFTNGWRSLAPRERLSVADSLIAALDAGTLRAGDVLARMPQFAEDEHRAVATAPMPLVRWTWDHLVVESDRP